MKIDQSFEHSKQVDVAKTIRTSLGISDTVRVIVAGSTHPQEEEYLLDAYHALSDSLKNVVLVIAPRHIERAQELEEVVARYKLPCVRRSQMSEEQAELTDPQSPRVILLDSRGELPYVYSFGMVSFVGGTLVPVGGHNVLEPAQWARPVLFGSYIDHCRESAHLLLQAGGAIQVHHPKELVSHFIHLLEHPAVADQMGKQALSVIQANRGVVEKNLRMIRQLSLSPSPTESGSCSSGIDSSVPHPDSMENRYEHSRTISF
jgi:3-deoxy-D-manno-octulosonic-acid transferase